MDEIRRRAKPAAAPVACVCVIVYYGYHLVEGDRGLRAYARLTQEVAQTRDQVAKVAAERRRLERRVALLRPDGLDLDMLDEQARRVLGVVRPDDVVLFDNH